VEVLKEMEAKRSDCGVSKAGLGVGASFVFTALVAGEPSISTALAAFAGFQNRHGLACTIKPEKVSNGSHSPSPEW
jgi:hypothetical protein